LFSLCSVHSQPRKHLDLGFSRWERMYLCILKTKANNEIVKYYYRSIQLLMFPSPVPSAHIFRKHTVIGRMDVRKIARTWRLFVSMP
jgi:hypothetical protein